MRPLAGASSPWIRRSAGCTSLHSMSPALQGGWRAAQAFMGLAPPRRLFGLLGSIQAYMNGLLYGDPALRLKGSVQQARG